MPDRIVEFKSASFPKYPNENDEVVNTNCWGKRLVEYVRDHLPEHGVPTGGILCEELGLACLSGESGVPNVHRLRGHG